MENFIAYNPTVLHFGKDVVSGLGSAVAGIGKRVLLVYGKNSIKENGIYRQVMSQLEKIKAEVYEYSGIRPNPIIEDVDAAVSLGRIKQVDVILAVGGGSVIDTAKAVSITIPSTQKAWDFYSGKAKPVAAVPVVAVLTLAATGTEMNPFAVIQNNKSRQKIGFGNPLMFPKHAFLDPAYTISVPTNYTAYGIADLVAHALEAWFGKGKASLPDRITASVIREAVEFGPELLSNPGNYELRAQIMYAATLALNGLTMHGRAHGEWGVHAIGHVLSVMYDVPHGASLSIAYPAWLRLMADRCPERISELGQAVFGTSDVNATIQKMEEFFRSVGSPVSLTQYGIQADKHPEIVELMKKSKVSGIHYKLGEEDYPRLLNLMN